MAEKHLKKCSVYSVIKQMQVKTILRFHLIPDWPIKKILPQMLVHAFGERGTVVKKKKEYNFFLLFFKRFIIYSMYVSTL